MRQKKDVKYVHYRRGCFLNNSVDTEDTKFMLLEILTK